MELLENERLDYVNDSLSLIQNTEGLTFGTDALLLAGYIDGGYQSAAELGGGTGIISMLLATRGKAKKISCIEIQEEYAALIRRNLEYNALTDVVTPLHADIREASVGECDLVFSNPPYMKTTSGYANRVNKKNAARHELNGSILDFCLSAKRMLKWGGDLYIVYRPDRLADLISAMREAGIEPKRLTLVHADALSEPSMLLIEGRRGGKPGMRVTRPLLIYSDHSHGEYSADMNYIMEKGEFPEGFRVS